ncbi:MAG: hypothetical protein AB1598_06005 [Thermodesulfobacteriota bacterium]
MKRKRMVKVIDFILLFLDEKKQKSSDRTEFAKNLMYSLNLPIPPHPVEDF